MKTIFKAAMAVSLLAFFAGPVAAQKNSKDKQKSSSNGTQSHVNMRFLANRDAKRWVLGLQAGPSLFHGDANKTKLGIAGGLNVRYNFSHVLGFRALANYGTLKAEVGSPGAFNMRYYNFTSKIFEYQAQVILTLGNISFFKSKWNWNLYTAAGIGQVVLRSKANFEYVTAPAGEVSHFQYDKTHICFTYGLGIKHNINKTLDLGVEYGMRWVRSDSVDILNAPIHPNRKFDFYSFPQVVLNIKLGKSGKEHLDWINPIASVYEDINTLNEKLDKLDKDSDGDGVSDRFDKEENTPAGAKVWGSGEAVDLDGDGVPDANDQEPNSPAGAKVDPNTGIAEDEDGDGVPDILDLSPGTDPRLLVNHQGIPIMSKEVANQIKMDGDNVVGGMGGGGGVAFLPAVFFATNVDEPYPTHLADLQGIAIAMKNNPGLRLEVIGNADSRNTDEYNMRLAQRRADNVKKILVQFGVDASRLITKTNGERVPVATGNSPMQLQANRRVQFFIVK